MSLVIGGNDDRKRRIVEDRRASLVSMVDGLAMRDTHIAVITVAGELNEGVFFLWFLWRPIPSPTASAATTTMSAKATKPRFVHFREVLSPTTRSCDLLILSLLSTPTTSGGKVL